MKRTHAEITFSDLLGDEKDVCLEVTIYNFDPGDGRNVSMSIAPASIEKHENKFGPNTAFETIVRLSTSEAREIAAALNMIADFVEK